MFKKILILWIVFSFVLVVSLFAQTIIKDDFRVNDDFNIGGSNQRMPAIAMDQQGNFVVVWFDERNTGLDIYGQRFDHWGNPLGENFKVSDGRGEGKKRFVDNIGLAMDAEGDFVVVWQEYGDRDLDVYAQRYGSNGSPIGSNFKVNNNLDGSFRFGPAVAMTPSGEFVVVWTDNRERSFFIYGQRYSSLGESMGNNFKIVSPQGWNSTYYRPTVSVNPKGDFVITWTATLSQTRREIHAIRVSAKNEILASAFKVNDSDSTAFPSFPDVAMDASGDFVITWQEQRSESQDIYAQRYNFKGEASGSNFRVNETRGQYFKGLPKVAMNLSEKFVIAWLDSRYSLTGIYLQYYDQSGEPEGNNIRVDNIGTLNLSNFDMAKTPSGYLTLTWNGSGCNYETDIFAMVLNQKGEIVKDQFKVENDLGSSSQSNPAIASSAYGNSVISWNDTRLCDFDIFAQRLSSSGEVLSSNFEVNQESGESKQGFQPSVSMDSSGKSVVVFQGNQGIYFQRYDLDGAKIGPNTLIKENTFEGFGYEPSVSMDSKGDFVVVWTQVVGYQNSFIFAQLYDSNGNKVGTNFMVNSFIDTTLASEYPKVNKCSNGNFVVVWQNYYRVGYKPEIWGQLYDPSGKRIAENFKIADSTVDEWNHSPNAGMDKEGNFVVVWGGLSSIMIQRFKEDGAKIGPIIEAIDSYGLKGQKFSLTVKSNGEFMVVWEDYRNGNQDIYAQRFDSEGNPIGGNFRVNSDQGDKVQMSPVVAADDKNYYFAWVDNRNLGSGYDIFAKIISFEPTFVSEPGVLTKPEFSVLQNYPNPFNPATTIPFTVGGSRLIVHSPVRTTLKIYNILGQKVRTLVDEDKLPGSYQVIWDGKDEGGKEVSSGVYFYVIKAQDFIQTRKMTLLR